MIDIAPRMAANSRPWPLTTDARRQLIDEIARLRHEVVALAGQGLEEGIVSLPVAFAERRLDTLTGVLSRAELVGDAGCAAIGRRATLRDDGGHSTTYDIVFPGDGDPTRGRISADSPLGKAILGAEAGDVVHVTAPSGGWSVTVISVE